MSPERAARRMLRLLEAEREAARGGDLAGLAEMSAHKERLAEAIEAGASDGAREIEPTTLKRLADALAQTAPLLAAALQGLRAARAREAQAGAPLRTYGRDGRAGTVAPARSGPVRRV